MKTVTKLAFTWLSFAMSLSAIEETLPPLKEGKAPQSVDELWGGYDPRKEPLQTEIIKEWEQEGVVMRVLRYRIGSFKGKKAMMAAIYGFPKGGTHLPALVQIHGGGQYANSEAVMTNAQRGYATISLAWAGRISAPGYLVTEKEVKLFWEEKTSDPQYKLTTDWGNLDAYHAPCRNAKNSFSSVLPAEWTLDQVESPRNSPWFLCTLGARRALTFLEQQPEVDPEKLGVYGHSMGGKLTVLTTAADSRVKASAPSCGGISVRNDKSPIFANTLGDDASLKRISCPIIFLSPANDFHGRIDDLQKALGEIRSKEWRVTCSAHHQHQDTAPYQVAGLLWMDQWLKGNFKFPRTPEVSLKWKGGIPTFTVSPDDSTKPVSVDIFYTQQGQNEGEKDITENTKSRFWRLARGEKHGKTWSADLPLFDLQKPVWVYANVLYPLTTPVTGAGYYYSRYTATDYNISSAMLIVTPAQLQAAGAKATLKSSLLIELFDKDWQKQWFTYDTSQWPRKTHKLYDPVWQAPDGAKLAIDIRSENPNKLVIGLDQHATEIPLKGGSEWQKIILTPTNFQNAAGVSLSSWESIRELRLGSKETLKSKDGEIEKKLDLGATWQGSDPQFRNLKWAQ